MMPSAACGNNLSNLMARPIPSCRLSLLKNVSDLGARSSATIEPAGRDLGRTTGPMCASAEAVEKEQISLTQPRLMDCGGSGRATFVAIMQAADLRKCEDLASRRRLDAAGV
jgi:hypothetical protein